jgi:hypothetical protein
VPIDCTPKDVWLRSRGPSATFVNAKPQGRIRANHEAETINPNSNLFVNTAKVRC